MVGLETGSVSSSVMHASSSTEAICAMMLHRTGSLRALKISVGGCADMASLVMKFLTLYRSARHVATAEYFHNYDRSSAHALHTPVTRVNARAPAGRSS